MDARSQMTPEETEAFALVKGLLENVVDPGRLSCVKVREYSFVQLDGRNTRTICRLYLRQQKYLGIINERKVETKVEIAHINDIANYRHDMMPVVRKFTNGW